MSFRSLLAGPSRTIARSASIYPSRPSLQGVRHITIPHPDTILPQDVNGGRDFVIKTDGRLHDVIHVLACVRAAESALGTPIISVNISRDPDSLRAAQYIYISTLKAIEYSTPIKVSIAPPRLLPTTQFGGPSLADVEAVLSSRPSDPAEGEESLNLQIVLDSTSRTRISGGPSRTPARIRQKAERQTVPILDALENLGGDWAKIAEKWDHLRPFNIANIANRETRPDLTSQTDSDIVEDLTSDFVDRVTGETARKEVRDAKHRRHARETEPPEKRSQDTERTPTLDDLRKHSKEARELRHKQRLEREAERQAQLEEKAASRWKFDLNDTKTKPELSELKITSKTSSPISIRRRAPSGSITIVDENAAEAAERAAERDVEARLAEIQRRKAEKESEAREQQRHLQEDALKRMVEIAERDAIAQKMTEDYRREAKALSSISAMGEKAGSREFGGGIRHEPQPALVEKDKKSVESQAAQDEERSWLDKWLRR